MRSAHLISESQKIYMEINKKASFWKWHANATVPITSINHSSTNQFICKYYIALLYKVEP